MSRVLTVPIALAIVAAVLMAVKPWDSGREVPHGPKAELVSAMKAAGPPKTAAKLFNECTADRIDREMTDADAVTLRRIAFFVIRRSKVDPDPAATLTALPDSAAAVFGKFRVIALECGEELIADGEIIRRPAIGGQLVRGVGP